MPQINDAVVAVALPSDHNDTELAYYLANGATTEVLQDAEREFLLLQLGVTDKSTQDMWFDFLTTALFTGALDDMKLAFWDGEALP